MHDDTLFSEIRLNGKPLGNCEMALECNNRHYRLYVDREPKTNSFHSIALEWSGCASDGDIWDCEDTTATPLFNSTAYFDGVRHLEFNREAGDMAGYIYYPNIAGLTDLFAKLREIELETCRDCDK